VYEAIEAWFGEDTTAGLRERSGTADLFLQENARLDSPFLIPPIPLQARISIPRHSRGMINTK